MIEELLKDVLREARTRDTGVPTAQVFIETMLDNIYQFFYKNGQSVHTVAIGILRGATFDMHYKGRIVDKFAEMFGAMSYESTIAGRACELYTKEGKPFLHLYSREKITEEFESASTALRDIGRLEEAEALRQRAKATIDQGVGSFLLMPLAFGKEIIGIFTISSLKESDETHILGMDIAPAFTPLVQLLSVILYIEKISYDKAEEMGRLLVSSIDGKDEYQATHSLNVRTMIDMFIDELSRDKDLRVRVEGIGLTLTVERIEKLRLAALLHDMGKIFVPSSVLRKFGLNKEELLLRKMHSYCTYNILRNSKTLGDIADIASMHHARYFIPPEKYATHLIGYPFDRVGQHKFSPESQIIALADTFNSIIRSRPDRKGLTLMEALTILEKEEYKFHQGLKDIFLTIVRRVEHNLTQGIYSPMKAEEYRKCLWIEDPDIQRKKEEGKWTQLQKFLDKIAYNHLGIIALMDYKDAAFLLKEDIQIQDKPFHLMTVHDTHVLLSIGDIPKEEGFVWVDTLFTYLKSLSFKGKVSFAFVGKRGHIADIQKIYKSLQDGMEAIKNEPVHYYLHPEMYRS